MKKSPNLGISDPVFFCNLHNEFVIILNFPFLDTNAELSSYTLEFGPGRFFFEKIEADSQWRIKKITSRNIGDWALVIFGFLTDLPRFSEGLLHFLPL